MARILINDEGFRVDPNSIREGAIWVSFRRRKSSMYSQLKPEEGYVVCKIMSLTQGWALLVRSSVKVLDLPNQVGAKGSISDLKAIARAIDVYASNLPMPAFQFWKWQGRLYVKFSSWDGR